MPRSANEWPPLRATQRIRRLEPDGEAVASVSRIPRGRTISALTSRHNHGGADHRSWSRQSRSNLMKLVSRAGRHSGWPLFSLPTHREVVAAAFRISALGAPYFKSPPAPVRSMLRVCIPRRRDTEAVLYERRDTQERNRRQARFCTIAPRAAHEVPRLIVSANDGSAARPAGWREFVQRRELGRSVQSRSRSARSKAWRPEARGEARCACLSSAQAG